MSEIDMNMPNPVMKFQTDLGNGLAIRIEGKSWERVDEMPGVNQSNVLHAPNLPFTQIKGVLRIFKTNEFGWTIGMPWTLSGPMAISHPNTPYGTSEMSSLNYQLIGDIVSGKDQYFKVV